MTLKNASLSVEKLQGIALTLSSLKAKANPEVIFKGKSDSLRSVSSKDW